tara:strand:+ start:104342 stop:104551 length:210 start_codon:yes stop_codon:yes gene_type:complete
LGTAIVGTPRTEPRRRQVHACHGPGNGAALFDGWGGGVAAGETGHQYGRFVLQRQNGLALSVAIGGRHR